MPKVSKQTAAKGGVMTAVLGMIGNVVGIGIFFKNNTVFRLNQNNAVGVLLAWIISTFIVLCMAISFGEIASGKTKNGKAGIGPWADTFCGHKFGRYSKLGYNLIFWPINTFAVMFFAGEALLNIFAPLNEGWTSVSGYNYGRGTATYIFAIGAALFALFILVNYLKFKSMTKVGKGISYVKFLPIALVVIIGIIFGALNGRGYWTNGTNTVLFVANNASNAASSINLFGIISCIPAILFSFEGYVAIDSFKNDLSDPERQIPLGVVLGVVVIACLYLAVTIGCITTGTGDVYQLMTIIFGPKGKFANDGSFKALTTLVSIFIFVCLIGCVNGMTRGGITSYQELCADNIIFKGKKLTNVKPGNQYFAGAISFSIVVAIWFSILLIPSAIWNTDAIADGSSTSMVVCLYIIYGSIVVCALANRFNKRVSIKKTKVFPVAAVIGMIGCLFMIGYVAFFQFLVAPIVNGLGNPNAPIIDPLDPTKYLYKPIIDARAGWGMFVSSKCPGYHTLNNGEFMAFFWGMTAFAAISPLLNDLLIKWLDKDNKSPLMWQKANKKISF